MDSMYYIYNIIFVWKNQEQKLKQVNKIKKYNPKTIF